MAAVSVYGSKFAKWPWTLSVVQNDQKVEEGETEYGTMQLKIDMTVSVLPRVIWPRESKERKKDSLGLLMSFFDGRNHCHPTEAKTDVGGVK